MKYKRSVSLAVCLMLLLSLFPAAVWAEGQDSSCAASVLVGETATEYSDFSAAWAAVCESEAPSVLTLYQDLEVGPVSADNPAAMEVTSTVTVDLNGHSVSTGAEAGSTAAERIFVVRSGGKLTLRDTSSEKNGEVLGNASSALPGAAVFVEDGASFTLYGGTIRSDSGTALWVSAADGTASAMIKGGTVLGSFGKSVEGTGTSTIEVSGGTFNQNPGEYLAAGYGAEGPTDDLWTVKPAVWAVTSKGVTTCYDAISTIDLSSTSDVPVTVTLCKDWQETFTAAKNIGGGTDPIEVILNLNGHTLTSGTGSTERCFTVKKNATLTVCGNGEIRDNSSATIRLGSIIQVSAGATLNIESGTFGSSTADRVILYARSGTPESHVTLSGGIYEGNVQLLTKSPVISGGTYYGDITYSGTNVLSIKGGNFSGTVKNSGDKGKIEITGGAFSGKIANEKKGSITISSGTFSGDITNASTGGKVSISGGLFKTGPSADFLETGYTAVFDEESKYYGVKSGASAVAALGEQEYYSFTEALDAANEAEGASIIQLKASVVLYAQQSTDYEIAAGKDITLNLNGCSVKNAGSSQLFTVKGNLTIEGEGEITDAATGLSQGDQGSLFYVDGGTLTVEGGTFTGTSGAAGLFAAANGGTIAVKGGWFDADVAYPAQGYYSCRVSDPDNAAAGCTVTQQIIQLQYDYNRQEASAVYTATLPESLLLAFVPGRKTVSETESAFPVGQSCCFTGWSTAPEGTEGISVAPGAAITVDAAGNITASGSRLGTWSGLKDASVLTLYAQWREITGEETTAAVTEAGASTGTVYPTLGEAILNAGDNSTVSLLENTGECIAVPAGKCLTLDLNGCTLGGTENEGPAISLRKDAILAVTDSSSAGSGKIIGKPVAVSNEGSFAMDSGCVSGILCGSGTAAISGGTFTVDPMAYVTAGKTTQWDSTAKVYEVIDADAESGQTSPTVSVRVTESGTGGTESISLPCSLIADTDAAVLSISTLNIAGSESAAEIGIDSITGLLKDVTAEEKTVCLETGMAATASVGGVAAQQTTITTADGGTWFCARARGASLRYDQKISGTTVNGKYGSDGASTKAEASDYLNLRLEYEFTLPEGVSMADDTTQWGWTVRYGITEATVNGVNYKTLNAAERRYQANIVFTNIPLNDQYSALDFRAELWITFCVNAGTQEEPEPVTYRITQSTATPLARVVDDLIDGYYENMDSLKPAEQAYVSAVYEIRHPKAETE